jgi:hypothetical protein
MVPDQLRLSLTTMVSSVELIVTKLNVEQETRAILDSLERVLSEMNERLEMLPFSDNGKWYRRFKKRNYLESINGLKQKIRLVLTKCDQLDWNHEKLTLLNGEDVFIVFTKFIF